MQKISVKNIYLLLVIAIGLIGLGVGSSYAMFTASSEIDNPISFTAGLSDTSNILETAVIDVDPGETNTIEFDVSNNTSTTLNYVIWYIDEGNNITPSIKRSDGGSNQTTITAGSTHKYLVSVKNNGTTDIATVTIGVSASQSNVILGEKMIIIS